MFWLGRTLLSTFCLSLIVVGVATAATPKPWQWTPAQVAKALVAQQPREITLSNGKILSAKCVGVGKGVKGRFGSFRCDTVFDLGNGTTPTVVAWVRIKQSGKGAICSSRKSLAQVGPPCVTVLP